MDFVMKFWVYYGEIVGMEFTMIASMGELSLALTFFVYCSIKY